MFYYLGIDIGGEKNTWAIAIEEKGRELKLLENSLSLKNLYPPVSLTELISFVQIKRVLVLTIDAPLSFSLEIKGGLRRADKALREQLPKEAKNWVVSYHALMGIPIRSYLLAKALSPYCGAILETHPRANFYFLLPKTKKFLAFKYKKEGLNLSERQWLAEFIEREVQIKLKEELFLYEGLVDAFFSALCALFFIKAPEKLHFLAQDKNLEGFGPFVVLNKRVIHNTT